MNTVISRDTRDHMQCHVLQEFASTHPEVCVLEVPNKSHCMALCRPPG